MKPLKFFLTLLPLGFVAMAGCEEPLDEEEDAPGLCDHKLSPASDITGMLGAAFDDYDPALCIPDRSAWESVTQEMVETHCGSCHGAEPGFGAPLSLLEYDAVTAGEPGNRTVDRMARRIANHTMPPPTSPALEHDAFDSLIEWATCGEVHPDHTIGREVDREPYVASVPANLELPSFDLLAGGFELDRYTLDLYQCFAIDVPVEEPRFLRRLQLVLDESRVLHHVTVLHDPDRISAGADAFECSDWPRVGTPMLWAWASDTGAFDFEEGGLRIQPGERMVVQIHYNNGAGVFGVADNSGVRVFHGPAEGQEWIMWYPGPIDFLVPEGESVACDVLEVDAPMRVLAGAPHMHGLGAEFHSTIEREDGTEDALVNLTGWNFEAHLFYRYDAVLEPGDRLHTWCGYRNDTGSATTFGLGTEQEMCFNFMYVSVD